MIRTNVIPDTRKHLSYIIFTARETDYNQSKTLSTESAQKSIQRIELLVFIIGVGRYTGNNTPTPVIVDIGGV